MNNKSVGYTKTFLLCAFIALIALFVIVYAFQDSTDALLYRVDTAILKSIQSIFSGSVSDFFFPKITVLGNSGIFWIILSAVFAVIPKTRRMGFTMMLAMLLGLLFGNLFIKNIVARMRPYQMDSSIQLIISKPREFSFPSGHTLCSFSAALSIFYCRKRLGICMLALASTIALSRMYLYVHFPTDILGGILLAIITSGISMIIIDKVYNAKNQKILS